MAPDPLRLLIEGRWPDPDSGAPVGVTTRSVVIEPSLAGAEADLVGALDLGRVFAVVSDPTTREVLGARVERALASLGTVMPIVLDARPHANAETAAAIMRASAPADALVAVGSGTINDLCKHAAAHAAKPYVVFATAPSMNGYTSSNAAITVNGHKKSLPSKAAAGVFVDLAVLCAAPLQMIRAGLGDSLCRTTAQADWLMSHVLRQTAYRQAPFALLAPDEPVLLEHSEALVAGDGEAMGHLARTLVLSGFGMSICGGSYPASQGEHLISHYLDTMLAGRRNGTLHGEQVAVATLTMARVQERLLADGPPRLTASRATPAMLVGRFGALAAAECWEEFERKA
jgi:glycerol-1-phosphate dehydrogenase [NAD(P)+]